MRNRTYIAADFDHDEKCGKAFALDEEPRAD